MIISNDSTFLDGQAADRPLVDLLDARADWWYIEHRDDPGELADIEAVEEFAAYNCGRVRLRPGRFCRQGHYIADERDVYRYPDGRRHCRRCLQAKYRRWYHRRKARLNHAAIS